MLILPFKVIQAPRELVMIFEHQDPARQIYLDGRPLPKDPEPSWMGYSSGKWDNDTLVMNVGVFSERFWFTNGGLPHTESLKLTERYTRPDFDTLKYEVTVNDPGAYTRPWSGGWIIRWQDAELYEYVCQDNNRDVKHMFGGPRE